MSVAARPFELIIFDCDGVVVDSEPICTRVSVDLIAELGLSMSAEEHDARFTGHTIDKMMVDLAALYGRPLPGNFRKRLGEQTFAALAAECQAVDGVRSVIDALRQPFCVASNGPHAKMRVTLGASGLLSLFEQRMFSSQDVERGKPAPDLFLLAARRFGVAPHDCLVVEDSATGVTAARAAGMSVVGYAARTPADKLLAAGAPRVIEAMHQLPALIDGGRIEAV